MTAPHGHVTLVFTDIENSSRMTSSLGNRAYGEQIREPHNARVRDSIASHNGHEVKTIGDSFMIAFHNVDDALACVCDIQRRLSDPPIAATDRDDKTWTCRVRIGVHTAEKQLQPDAQGDYHGGDVNFAARVESLGVGGQVLVSDAAYRAADQPAHEWEHWRDRRIKSFDAPETVHELLWDGESRGEPGSRWFPDWYFGEQNAYIERPDKQNEVFRALEHHRLVTLHADGGMGKTRLAVYCATRIAARFKDGSYFVSLDGAQPTAQGVAEACATAMGESGVTPDALIDLLKERETLFLLDNYESVADKAATVGEFLGDLLQGTRDVRLLATGRRAVGLVGVEDEIELDDGMTDEEARDLFLKRARLQRGRTDWMPDATERVHLERVLKLTLKIPLAIELAAAWMGRESVKWIADELEKKPLGSTAKLPLGVTIAKARARFRSLWTCFDLTFDKLDEATQKGFAALSVFADTFTPESAAAICDLPESNARELLYELYDFSLIRRREADGDNRYWMHRFARDYAASKRATDDDAERRYVACFERIATEYGGVATPNDKTKIAVLDAEFANIQDAAETAERLREWDGVQTLSEKMSTFCILRGAWAACQTMNERALRAAREQGDRPREGVALNNLGEAYRIQGKWSEAEDCYQQSLAIKREFGDRVGEGQTLNNLGVVYQLQGKWSEAEDCYQQSLVIRQEFGDRVGEGQTLNNLGNVYQLQGKWSEAEGCYQQSLTIRREFGDRVGEGKTLNNLGGVCQLQGKWSEAEDCYEQDLAICREFGDRVGEGITLMNLGVVYKNQEKWSEAEDCHEQSLAISREFGDRVGEGRTLANLALLRESQDDLPGALAFARQSYAVLETTEYVAGVEKVRGWIAEWESATTPSP
ncbi:MAG: tetratricopeptide repeat protein [Candidatus Poribacteria bacterium]|nr:tetratricopeptide repeat protein [Candidatus Poribacteria bacterium]